jgi:hypothetical protein
MSSLLTVGGADQVRKLLLRASAIWRNKELMARFNRWCWFCQNCEDGRNAEVARKAAERYISIPAYCIAHTMHGVDILGTDSLRVSVCRQRRREAWLLKQLFKGVGDAE